MRGLSALVLALVTFFAGCTTPAEVADPLPTDGVQVVDPTTGAVQTVRAVTARFDGAAQALMQDFTGEFAAGQHWTNHGELLAQAGQSANSMHAHDITALVPKGIPVRVIADLQADMDHGDLDVFFDFAAGDVWTTAFNAPFGGNSRLEFLVVRTTDDPVNVFVFYDEAEPAASVPYALRVEAHTDPVLFVPGVPILLDVTREALRVEVDFNGTTGEVLVWSPDDTFLGRVAPGDDGRANITVDDHGAYVLLVPQGMPQATVQVWAPAQTPPVVSVLRAAKQDIQSTSPAAFAADQPGSISFDVMDMPIQVGLEIRVDDITNGASGTLDSPESNLITYEFSDDLPFLDPDPTSDMGFMMLTTVGAAGLVPGTYTATFTGEPNGSGALVGWIVHYAR